MRLNFERTWRKASGRAHPGVNTICADCQTRMPFDDGYFDRILAVHVLEHLPNLPAALDEIYRLCNKKTGHFFSRHSVRRWSGVFAWRAGFRPSAFLRAVTRCPTIGSTSGSTSIFLPKSRKKFRESSRYPRRTFFPAADPFRIDEFVYRDNGHPACGCLGRIWSLAFQGLRFASDRVVAHTCSTFYLFFILARRLRLTSTRRWSPAYMSAAALYFVASKYFTFLQQTS